MGSTDLFDRDMLKGWQTMPDVSMFVEQSISIGKQDELLYDPDPHLNLACVPSDGARDPSPLCSPSPQPALTHLQPPLRSFSTRSPLLTQP